jgi:hypothetical protein
MAKKLRGRPDHRRVKRNRSYSIEEVARLLGVHKNTVRAWIRDTLQPVDRTRPQLIRGVDLIDFLKRRRILNKRPCGPGQIYCVPCRTPQVPACEMADYVAKTDRTGSLSGLCPKCERMIYRTISWARFEEACGTLEVRIMKPHLRIADSASSSVNSDFEQE